MRLYNIKVETTLLLELYVVYCFVLHAYICAKSKLYTSK